MPDKEEPLKARADALEARLLDVTKEVTRIYHDLSNPMSALTGNVELLAILAEENPIDTPMRDTIRDLGLAVEKLGTTLEGLRHLRQALRTGDPV